MTVDSATCRLFIALWPDPAVRTQLSAWRDGWRWPRGASPVPDDKLHLTLHFLGEQPRERVPALLAACAQPFTPFSLRIERAATWHNGIAVLEPERVPPALLDLHARLAQALTGLGLPPEARAYRPHVTMARRAQGAAMPQAMPAIDWHVTRCTLVESRAGTYVGCTATPDPTR